MCHKLVDYCMVRQVETMESHAHDQELVSLDGDGEPGPYGFWGYRDRSPELLAVSQDSSAESDFIQQTSGEQNY